MPGNIIRRWTHGGGVKPFRQPSNMTNGLTYDRKGGFLPASTRRAASRAPSPTARSRVLATHYDGKELNSPNDIVVDRDGAIYFSDPTFGRMEYYGVPREPELAFRGVYRIDPATGGLTLLVDDFDQPNGLCFSLDEKRLFVNDTMRAAHPRLRRRRRTATLSKGGDVFAETVGEGAGGSRRHEDRQRR